MYLSASVHPGIFITCGLSSHGRIGRQQVRVVYPIIWGGKEGRQRNYIVVREPPAIHIGFWFLCRFSISIVFASCCLDGPPNWRSFHCMATPPGEPLMSMTQLQMPTTRTVRQTISPKKKKKRKTTKRRVQEGVGGEEGGGGLCVRSWISRPLNQYISVGPSSQS